MMSAITVIVIDCLKQLRNVVVSGKLLQYDTEVQHARWEDELGRLRVWAANIGAHQTGNLSLDNRLRDATHIKDQTLRILQRLNRVLEDLQDTTEDPFGSAETSSSDDEGTETEVQLVYSALCDTINNLFQMSIAIRRPAPHDRLLGTQRIDALAFEPFDKQHTANKYPRADPEIQNRLGLAISQRRAILRYRERHSKKLGQSLNSLLDDQSKGHSTELSETALSNSMQTSSTQQEEDMQSIVSQTSYAETLLSGSEGSVLPPPPVGVADGAPFECPYCYRIISYTGLENWARHVFLDVMPYICVFPNCPTPQRLYESRREWYFHLQSQHSVESDCKGCISCPLCASPVAAGRQYEKHLALHLQELALFALPRPDPQAETAQPSELYSRGTESQQSLSDDNSLCSGFARFRFEETGPTLGEDLDSFEFPKPGDLPRPDIEHDAERHRKDDLRKPIPGHAIAQEHRYTADTIIPIEIGISGDEYKGSETKGQKSEEDTNFAQTREREHIMRTEEVSQMQRLVLLRDTFGHEFKLLWEHCNNWELITNDTSQRLNETIKRVFAGIEALGPGFANGNYDLIGPDGSIITPHAWESSGTHDLTITLHMRPIPERSKTESLPNSAPKWTHSNPKTHMYICCQCADGPKLYNMQPRCVVCFHIACSLCVQVK